MRPIIMKIFNKTSLLTIPLLLITSCENRVFGLGDGTLYLPEPTKIAFKTTENVEYVLNEEVTSTFYDKFLKNLKFERHEEGFFGDFTFYYYYDFDNYQNGDNPLEFRLGNFNCILFDFNYRAQSYTYVYPKRVPYLEIVNFLTENSSVISE